MKQGRWEILNKVNDIPLKYKFILIYVMCVLIPIVTINLVFLGRITASVRERESANFNIAMERAQSDIVGLITGCIAISHTISTDRLLYENLQRKYKDTIEYYQVYFSYLRDNVTRVAPIYNHISEIMIYSTNPTIVSGGSCLYIDDEVRRSDWYKAIDQSHAKIILYAYQESKIYMGIGNDRYLCVLRKMNEFEPSPQGSSILKINIDIDRLYEIFDRELGYISICLVDPQNRMIFAPDNQFFGNLTRKKAVYDRTTWPAMQTWPASQAWGKKSLVFERPLGAAQYLEGWRIVGVADKQIILRALGQSRNSIFLLALFSTLVATLLILILVRSYNYRVRKLAKQMEKIKNQQFEPLAINEGKDEIGALIKSFNLMAVKINSLINDVYKLEIQKKDLELERVQAELNFLQSQMNPHFLFNTLNALLVVSLKNNYTEIIEVIRYLSKTLRRLLSWKDDLVTIEEEVAFSEMYLKIEKFRFGEKFHYEIVCDEEARKYKIPKMSIQPLIENACKHGIQTIKGIGRVCARIELTGEGTLKVTVHDNGSGIAREKLEEIVLNMTDTGVPATSGYGAAGSKDSIPKDGSSSGNIGIRNVYRRLKLYYGEAAHFEIKSQLNAGTEVSFAIAVDKLQPPENLEKEAETVHDIQGIIGG
ncbi:MAG TPA: sensor histidine kinase [Bacillota bacterium]|nr:sensor histidine kinase [Bacillota bacterium]